MPPRTVSKTTRTTRTAKPESFAEPVVMATQKARRVWPVIAVLVTLLLIALSVAGYFYYQYKYAAQAADAKEIEGLSQEIGRIMLLPEGETPTLATVTDKEKLADQPFFQKAENGDKVLIFSASGRAILYRPSEKKIIDVTTVNVNNPVQASPEAKAPVEAQPAPVAAPAIVRVALLNGSSTVGVTNTAENQLKTILPNVAVVSKDDAKKKDYATTTVVAMNSAASEAAAAIAQGLDGALGSLPEGEIAPADADVIVIIGASPAAETNTQNQ